MRVHGRLDLAPTLLYDEKHPILLPKSYVAYLIVRAQHILMKHAGVSTLITSLRNTFWIVSARTLAKKICKMCTACQRQDSRPCDQITSPLPEDRVKKSPPFSITGIDHAGPLFCAELPDKKLYILLFTCAVIRGIHIELVESLSFEDFILAFKRFSARRGIPSVVYSDNAKTFEAAHRYFQKVMGHVGLHWKFSAPLAPWWGGWWERLIRSVKSSLRKSLSQSLLSRIQLETNLHEIEACVNSRPLTYVEETGIPLTPSHFLIGRSSPMNPISVFGYTEEATDLKLRDQCQSQVLNHFWDIWQDKYIRNLPPMPIKKPNPNFKVGTIVLIREEGKTRLKWPLGIVTKTFLGKDGHIRAVELKTKRGHVTRALQSLHKLEMFEKEEEIPQSLSDDSEEKKPIQTRRGRLVKERQVLDL